MVKGNREKNNRLTGHGDVLRSAIIGALRLHDRHLGGHMLLAVSVDRCRRFRTLRTHCQLYAHLGVFRRVGLVDRHNVDDGSIRVDYDFLLQCGTLLGVKFRWSKCLKTTRREEAYLLDDLLQGQAAIGGA